MKLTRARLAPPGPPSATPGAYAGPAALALLLLAGGWCALAWTTGRASISYTGDEELPSAVVLRLDRPGMEERSERIARLNTSNPFDDEGWFWTRRAADTGGAVNPESTGDVPPLPINLTTQANTPRVTPDGEVQLTAEEDLPDDVKAARNNLELKGIHRDLAGTPIARIGFVQSTSRGTTMPRRPGELFKDPKHDKTPWIVARVDTQRNRVVLVRSGATIAIDLFPKGVTIAKAPREPQSNADRTPFTPAPGTPGVQGRTPEQIATDFREAGIPEADILLALELMELPTESVEVPVTVINATPERVPAIDDDLVKEATGDAPEGFSDIMRQLKAMQDEAEARRKPKADG